MWTFPLPPLASLKSQGSWDWCGVLDGMWWLSQHRRKHETCSGSTGQDTAGTEQGTGQRHKGMTWSWKEKLQETERDEQNEPTLHRGVPTIYSVVLPYLLTHSQGLSGHHVYHAANLSVLQRGKMYYTQKKKLFHPPTVLKQHIVIWQSSSSSGTVACIVTQRVSPTSMSEYYFYMRYRGFWTRIWKFSHLSCCISYPKPWCFHLCLQYRRQLRERKRGLLVSKSVN